MTALRAPRVYARIGSRPDLGGVKRAPTQRKEAAGCVTLPPQLHPVQRGPKPEVGWLAAEADGEFQIGAVEGAVGILGLGIAAVDGVLIPFPSVTRADVEAVNLVGQAQ